MEYYCDCPHCKIEIKISSDDYNKYYNSQGTDNPLNMFCPHCNIMLKNFTFYKKSKAEESNKEDSSSSNGFLFFVVFSILFIFIPFIFTFSNNNYTVFMIIVGLFHFAFIIWFINSVQDIKHLLRKINNNITKH